MMLRFLSTDFSLVIRICMKRLQTKHYYERDVIFFHGMLMMFAFLCKINQYFLYKLDYFTNYYKEENKNEEPKKPKKQKQEKEKRC